MLNTPQLEDGYLKIANEIIDALARYRIPGEQMQCLLVILRKTYGFNKKEDMISNRQFVELTGLKKGNVSRSIKALIDKKVVIKSDNRRIPTYRFNKIYATWKLLSKKQPVIKDATSVINIATSVIKSDGHKRHYTKDTRQKTETTLGHFDIFWAIYPKKKKKEDARKAFATVSKKNDFPGVDILVDAVKAQKDTNDWIKQGGKFIPYPATWLRAGSWQDEINTDPLEGVVSERARQTINNLRDLEL